jgi:branched-chain amino acid transport system permease protein
MTSGSAFFQQIVNGLTVGAVYALIALGYTMVYGIIELINFAHGEIYMLGAYFGTIAAGALLLAGVPVYVTLPLALLAAAGLTGLYGLSAERMAYRPLRKAGRLAPLITALGLSIFFQQLVLLTQGAKDKVFPLAITSAGVTLGPVRVAYIQMLILAVAAALMVGLQLFVQKTSMGRAMRCTAQDPLMASLVGVPVNRVISLTFVLGSSLAAVAGVLVVVYYGKVNYLSGYTAGLKAFTAAVLGGIGNIPGAMLGGIFLGVVEGLAAGYIGGEYKDVVAFVILVLVLIIRPQGLLGVRVPDKV